MEKVKNYAILVLSIAVIVFILLFNWKNNQCSLAQHNLDALNDTLTVVRMENNELLAYKKSLVLQISDLEKYTLIKESEVKRLQKELGQKIKYIAEIESQIRHDTINTQQDSVVAVDTTTYQYHFSERTPYYALAGFTRVNHLTHMSHTVITENTMPLNLRVGLGEDWTIFVNSDNPNVVIGSITGAHLNPKEFEKEKYGHLSIGFQSGFGGTVNYGLQFSNDGIIRHGWNVGAGWYFGLGFQYNFIVF